MTAFEYLKAFPYLPVSIVRGHKQGLYFGRPANAEIKRWLLNRAVIINGTRPAPHDEITFPIKELIFFPGGKRITTMVKEI